MIRSILVGLDGSAEGDSAFELGLRWAERFQARLIGMGVVDEPGVHGSEEYLVGERFFHRLNQDLLTETRQVIDGALERCATRCTAVGVAFEPVEEVGDPVEQILLEAQRHDVILLGQKTHFRFGSQDRPDDTLTRIVAEGVRPVVCVPTLAARGGPVVVAFDGSPRAARALATFVASGLGRSTDVHVVGVHAEEGEAARRIDRAVDFLRSHGIAAWPHPLDSDLHPAGVILDRVRQLGAGLLMLGAFGHSALRDFFLGSVTRTALRESPVPIFLDH